MIHCILSTKGGVGKSTFAHHVLPGIFSARTRKKNFAIIEIDDNNQSKFERSDLLKGRQESVRVGESREALARAVFSLLDGDGESEIIIDAGGGNDTRGVAEQVCDLPFESRYYIPIGSNRSHLDNLSDTLVLIPSEASVSIIINQSRAGSHPFYRGDESLKIKKWQPPKGRILSEIEVQESPIFELAEAKGLTLGDLAQLAYEIDHQKSAKILFEMAKAEAEKSGKDAMSIFVELDAEYIRAREARRLIEQLAECGI
jgi:hypothetical protein